MSNYTPTTDFSVKDGLTTGDPEKIVLGADFDVEFSAIETAVATKYDSSSLASQAQAEGGTNNTTLMTPLRTEQWSAVWAAENAGIIGDLQALAAPGADRLIFWDHSLLTAAFLTVSTGLSLSGTSLTTNDSAIVHDSLSGFVANEHIDHSSVSVSAGNGLTGGGTIAASRTLTLGTGGTVSGSSTNAVTASSHTHALDDNVYRGTLGSGNISAQSGGSPSGGSNGDIILIY